MCVFVSTIQKLGQFCCCCCRLVSVSLTMPAGDGSEVDVDADAGRGPDVVRCQRNLTPFPFLLLLLLLLCRRQNAILSFIVRSFIVVVVVVIVIVCCCCGCRKFLQSFRFSWAASNKRVERGVEGGVVVVVFKDIKSGDISSAISGIGFVVFRTLVICWLC